MISNRFKKTLCFSLSLMMLSGCESPFSEKDTAQDKQQGSKQAQVEKSYIDSAATYAARYFASQPVCLMAVPNTAPSPETGLIEWPINPALFSTVHLGLEKAGYLFTIMEETDRAGSYKYVEYSAPDEDRVGSKFFDLYIQIKSTNRAYIDLDLASMLKDTAVVSISAGGCLATPSSLKEFQDKAQLISSQKRPDGTVQVEVHFELDSYERALEKLSSIYNYRFGLVESKPEVNSVVSVLPTVLQEGFEYGNPDNERQANVVVNNKIIGLSVVLEMKDTVETLAAAK